MRRSMRRSRVDAPVDAPVDAWRDRGAGVRAKCGTSRRTDPRTSVEPVGEALADPSMPDAVVSGAPADDEPMTDHASPSLEIAGAFEESPGLADSITPTAFDPVFVQAVIVETPPEKVDATC
jgi:hypothetical protein